MTDDLRIRRAVRGLVITPDDDVLLVRSDFPNGTRWALPGGGLEPGETHVDALRRELREELGLGSDGEPAPIGPHLWTRRRVVPFPDGDWDGQEEHIHVVEVAEMFEPSPTIGWERLRAEYVREIRWWRPDELTATQARTDTTFLPDDLVDLVVTLRHNA
jgi:8-oxo-dGTP diphosphatase